MTSTHDAARSLRRAAVGLAAVLAAATGAEAQLPCSTYVKDFKNNSRTDNRICAGDVLQYTICVRSQSGGQPPLIWDNFLTQNCFASFAWVIPPPGADTSCSQQPIFKTRRGDACAQDFTVPPGGEVCGVINATLGSPINDLTACTLSLNVTWDLDGCSSSDTRVINCAPPGSPDLRLSKVIEGVDPTTNDRCFNSTVSEGSSVVFRIDLTNASTDGDDTGVVITDDVPAGLTNFRLLTPACTPCAPGCDVCFDPTQGPNGRMTATVGDLARSSGYTVRFSMDVPRTCGSGNWGFSNQASVTSDWLQANTPTGVRVSDNQDGDAFLNEATCSGPIARTGTAAATVTKTVDRTVAAPGDTVHFTVTFDASAGACPVTGTMRDDLPAGVALVPGSVVFPPTWGVTVGAPPAGAFNAGFVQVDSATIDGGTAPTIEFDAVIDTGAGCAQPDPNVANYGLSTGAGQAQAPRISITNPTPDQISVTKDVDQPIAVENDVLTYTITVLNQSACPIVDGTLDDPIPAGLVLDVASVTQSLSGPQNVSIATAVRFQNIDLDIVPPDNQFIITYQVRVDGTVGGDITNTAAVTFPTTSGSDSATVRVDLPPNCTTPPAAVTGLRGVKTGGQQDVTLTWDSAVNAATYNVFKVVNEDKTLIPVANKTTSQSNPDVVAIGTCQGVPDAGRTCVDVGAVPANPPHLLFYQVRGVCSDGLTEGDDHPF